MAPIGAGKQTGLVHRPCTLTQSRQAILMQKNAARHIQHAYRMIGLADPRCAIKMRDLPVQPVQKHAQIGRGVFGICHFGIDHRVDLFSIGRGTVNAANRQYKDAAALCG